MVLLGTVKYRVDLQRDANSHDIQLVFQTLKTEGGIDVPVGQKIYSISTQALAPGDPQPLQHVAVVELPVGLRIMG